MEMLLGTSLLAAFIAGIAALFAPCCITVLLPSYFGSIFRERRKVFLMTFIFFLGVLTVFLPLGLGISAIGQFFSRYHRIIFSLAGAFFLVLGAVLVTGTKMSLPIQIHPSLKKHNAVSVYVLGIFSGIATTCCAPVLAGVLALSVLPGSVLWGMVYTLAYVLGMVSPLFILAAFLDKADLTGKLMKTTGAKQFTLFGKEITATIPELVSGFTFLVMGFLTLRFAYENDLATHSEFQVNVNIYLTKLQGALSKFIGFIPEFAWALIFVGVFAWITVASIRKFKKEKQEDEIQK